MVLRVFIHFGGEPRLCYGTHEQLMMAQDGGGPGAHFRGGRPSVGAFGDAHITNGSLSNTSLFAPRSEFIKKIMKNILGRKFRS